MQENVNSVENYSICEICGLSTWVELGGGNLSEFPEGMPLYHPNIDIQHGPLVDIVADLEKGIPLHDEHAERIKSCHLINHLSMQGARNLIKECYRVLKPGGSIFIMVTDMDYVFEMVRKEGLVEKWITCIWGEQKDPYDFHKSGFNFALLKNELEKAGFVNVIHKGNYNPWEFAVEAYKG